MQTATTLRLFVLLLLAAAMITASLEGATSSREIFYADPAIYGEDGKYFLTGTRNAQPPGFAILESDNLREWREPSTEGVSFILRAGDGAFGTSRFWAPQIFKDGGNYFLTYTANEHVALAKSPALAGPYRQGTIGPIDNSEPNIDSYIFRDDDGRYYLYHVRFRRGNFLWVAEFDLDAARIKPGTLTRCFGQTQAWEATPSYRSVPIMEGPAVFKLKGKYYLLYSANHYRSIDYAVGCAVADSPLGPWVKQSENPILHRSIVGENGSGHGDVFRGPEGRLYYVYHVHHSETAVSPRRTRIVPLVLTWDERHDRYRITVDAANIIKPLTSSGAGGR